VFLPNWLRYGSLLFPTKLKTILKTVPYETLKDLDSQLTSIPWVFCLRSVSPLKTHSFFTEGKISGLRTCSELWEDTLDETTRRSLTIYEWIQKETWRKGHVFIKTLDLIRALRLSEGYDESSISESLKWLKDKKAIVCQLVANTDCCYIASMFESEWKLAVVLVSLKV